MKPTTLKYSMRCIAIPLVATLAGFFGAAILSTAQQNFDRVEVQTQPVQGNVYMLTGAGGNVTVQTGPDGVLIVDTQFEPMAPKLLAAIRKLSDKPIRYIINTHVHPDHTGGNAAIAQAAVPPADGGGSVAGQGAQVIAHENVLKVMSAPKTGSNLTFPLPKSVGQQRPTRIGKRSNSMVSRLSLFMSSKRILPATRSYFFMDRTL
jgi:glyoxylase-like metal-dependent hydrolase (beta-lactamase superfamily II)